MRYLSSNLRNRSDRVKGSLKAFVGLFVLVAVLLGGSGKAAEPVLTEYQVKALFLYKFIKYIEWSPEILGKTNSAFIIGIAGENKLGSDLINLVEGKTVEGHLIVVKEIKNDEDLKQCRMLFVSVSEKKRLRMILDHVRSQPILTVGETEEFTEHGGIINFMKRDGMVRLEIDLRAARVSQLRLSSKLLSVADVVKGKQ